MNGENNKIRCAYCGKTLSLDDTIYFMSLNTDILNPKTEWEKHYEHGSYWTSDLYCSSECIERDIHSVIASLKEFMEQEDFAKKIFEKSSWR